MKQSKRILVVESHDGIRRLLAVTLERHGYSVLEADSPTEGLDMMAEGEADLVIVELAMPGISGADMPFE